MLQQRRIRRSPGLLRANTRSSKMGLLRASTFGSYRTCRRRTWGLHRAKTAQRPHHRGLHRARATRRSSWEGLRRAIARRSSWRGLHRAAAWSARSPPQRWSSFTIIFIVLLGSGACWWMPSWMQHWGPSCGLPPKHITCQLQASANGWISERSAAEAVLQKKNVQIVSPTCHVCVRACVFLLCE